MISLQSSSQLQFGDSFSGLLTSGMNRSLGIVQSYIATATDVRPSGGSEMKSDVVNLSIDKMPKEWYNIVPDLPEPLPPAKDPEEGPSRIAQLERMYTKTSLQLDASKERWIKIPDEVWDLYVHVGRPRPLQRASRLERYLKTPARIYYKREDLSPTGSFKMNTTLCLLYTSPSPRDRQKTRMPSSA